MQWLGAALLLLPASLFMSCSSDDDYAPATEQTLTIVSNDLLFGSAASSSTVVVEADGTLTATIDADWATATVNGQTVTVSVDDNLLTEGRTAVLTLTTATASRRLPIQQLGMVLGSLPAATRHAPAAGETFSYTIPHDQPMTVASPQEWLHTDMQDNTLTVTVDDNTGGGLRRGIVTTECAGRRDTLLISQYDIEADITGIYYLYGSYGVGGAPVALRFDIVQRDGALYSNWPGVEIWQDTYIPVTFDEGNADLYLPSAFRLWSDNSGSDTGYFYDEDGTMAQSSNYSAKFHLMYTESVGVSTAALQTGNWPGHTIQGLVIYSIRAGGLSQQVLLNLYDPILVRAGHIDLESGSISGIRELKNLIDYEFERYEL